MKWTTRLLKIIVFSLILIIPNVFARTYFNDDKISEKSCIMLDTMYEAAQYNPPEPETYNVDLEWNDLHIPVFYNNSDVNQLSNTLITSDAKLLKIGLYQENKNLDCLNDQLGTSLITVKNNSNFAVNVIGKIKENKHYKKNSNYIKLEIAYCDNNCEDNGLDFKSEVIVNNLSKKDMAKFITNQVLKQYNDSKDMITDNIKLVFTKNN